MTLLPCATAETCKEMQQSLLELPDPEHSGWAVLHFSGWILISVTLVPVQSHSLCSAAPLPCVIPGFPHGPDLNWNGDQRKRFVELQQNTAKCCILLSTAILLMVQ